MRELQSSGKRKSARTGSRASSPTLRLSPVSQASQGALRSFLRSGAGPTMNAMPQSAIGEPPGLGLRRTLSAVSRVGPRGLRIVLVQTHHHYTQFTHVHPLGIMAIASAARWKGHPDVRLLDMKVEGWTPAQACDAI